MKRLSPLLVLMIACVSSAAVQGAEAPQRSHRITPEDYFSIAQITDLAVSPDGSRVAFTELRWEPPEATRNSDLWVVHVDGGTPRRLTFDRGTESDPQWSPDGQHIYFTTDATRPGEEKPPYDGSSQVWRVSASSGGAPRPVTRVAGGVGAFDLAGDGSALFYTTSTKTLDDPWKDLRELYPEVEYGHGVTPFGAVMRLDLDTWRTEEIVPATRVIHALAVAPVTGRIALLTTPDDEQIHSEGWSEVHVFDPRSGSTTNVTPESWRHTHPSPYGWINDVCWSSDGAALAFSVDFDGFPTILYAVEWEDGEPYVAVLDRPSHLSVKEGVLAWRGDGRDLAFIGHEKARSRVYVLENLKAGEAENLSVVTPGDVTVDAFDFDARGGTPAIISSTLASPPDIFVTAPDGSRSRLTHANPQIDGWLLPTIEIVSWTSADGTEVEGILELPPGYDPSDGPLPMIVHIHGGPTSATRYHLQFWVYGRTLMAANGYALLSPNYRGSTGYGDEFMVELIGHENNRDVEDILSGVDAMVDRGIADPERLGVMGWSNGGYLTNCLITRTDRFKAASSGAGVLDQNIQWATQDTPGHNINFMGGKLPWQAPERYHAASPLYGLGNVTTPTLIHVGGADPRVPPAHSRALYRALRQYLGVPTELVVYPDEGHSPTTYRHRKAKMEWDLAWFEHYLRSEGNGPTD